MARLFRPCCRWSPRTAALTTTALAAACTGDADAGRLAIVYVVITAGLGLFCGAFNSVDRYIQQLMSFKVGATVRFLMDFRSGLRDAALRGRYFRMFESRLSAEEPEDA